MATTVIIDGYNLLPVFESTMPFTEASLGQKLLLEALAAYRKTRRLKVVVVFDSWKAPPTAERAENIGGVTVVYTALGENADNAIKNRAARLKDAAIVVSDDREVRDAADKSGAATVGCIQFLGYVERAALVELKGEFDDEEQDRAPIKKGAARRGKKSKRRKNKRLEQL